MTNPDEYLPDELLSDELLVAVENLTTIHDRHDVMSTDHASDDGNTPE
jgi:hypothetical protein